MFALLLIAYPNNELLIQLELTFLQITQYSTLFRALGILLCSPTLRAEFLRQRYRFSATESVITETRRIK